jgi:predicted oxidoreductase
MTDKEIMKILQLSESVPLGDSIFKDENEFQKLKKIIETTAELEREECARIVDEWVLAYPQPSKTIAELIRKRGQE